MNIKVINYEGRAMVVPPCNSAEAHNFRLSPSMGPHAERYTCLHCHTMIKAIYVD